MFSLENKTACKTVSEKLSYFFDQRILDALISKLPGSVEMVRLMADYREDVIKQAMEYIDLSAIDLKNEIPFLPVFPCNWLSFNDQLNILIADPRGDGFSDVEEYDEKLNQPYFIFGARADRKKLLPLKTAEVISLAGFAGYLENFNILAEGSPYGSHTPLLKTSSAGFTKRIIFKKNGSWGRDVITPSCFSRIIFE